MVAKTGWGGIGVDCEFRVGRCKLLTFRKVGKTTRTRPYRYDLTVQSSQIPYDYTVEVTNRCKGLELIECLMN